MTDKKCPICGCRSFQISDYYAVAYLYEVIEGVVTADGLDDACGLADHVRTVCVCRQCGHVWNPRNFEFTIDG